MMRKLYEKYLLEGGITAKISPTEISLKTNRGQQQFMFRKSKPEVVAQVAKMFLEAVSISKEQTLAEFVNGAVHLES